MSVPARFSNSDAHKTPDEIVVVRRRSTASTLPGEPGTQPGASRNRLPSSSSGFRLTVDHSSRVVDRTRGGTGDRRRLTGGQQDGNGSVSVEQICGHQIQRALAVVDGEAIPPLDEPGELSSSVTIADGDAVSLAVAVGRSEKPSVHDTASGDEELEIVAVRRRSIDGESRDSYIQWRTAGLLTLKTRWTESSSSSSWTGCACLTVGVQNHPGAARNWRSSPSGGGHLDSRWAPTQAMHDLLMVTGVDVEHLSVVTAIGWSRLVFPRSAVTIDPHVTPLPDTELANITGSSAAAASLRSDQAAEWDSLTGYAPQQLVALCAASLPIRMRAPVWSDMSKDGTTVEADGAYLASLRHGSEGSALPTLGQASAEPFDTDL
ncbi:uncharacterized protein B0H18DRAFT_1122313 [Fomitopsis serialis]|uniref:uncharacterized protein n=1 Tax=Fomitopsis serialis TaxID=139415 RepID=UPI002007BFF3|nr:uncharacterized protein B0H18DRAFT_1122313 [Neoantrodia serialis]KAH9919874.1 hypothetical protein B0H18DRAFT_1122313 [Neoantrodia serialis]